MARVTCNACGSTYEQVHADGVPYFHACAPLSKRELQEAIDDGRARLPAGETIDEALQKRVYERANKRDENPIGGRGADQSQPKAEGDGVTPVAPLPSRRVVVPKKP